MPEPAGAEARIGEPDAPHLLSIVNAERKRIDGPSLLHELVAGKTSSSDIALDFLTADGKRTCISFRTLNFLTVRLAQLIKKRLCFQSTGDSVIPVLIPQ